MTRLAITCLITAALGATQAFGALFDGPADILNRTYDYIVVGGTPARALHRQSRLLTHT